MIQWEEPATMPPQETLSVKVLSLSYANQVSCIDYNTCNELLSNKYCEVKVVKLKADTYEAVSNSSDLQEVLVKMSDYLGDEMLSNGNTTSKIYDRGKCYPKHYSTKENMRKGTKLMIFNDLFMIWLQMNFSRKMTLKIVYDRGKKLYKPTSLI